MTFIETEHHKIESIIGLWDYLDTMADKLDMLQVAAGQSDVPGLAPVLIEMADSLRNVEKGLKRFDLIPKPEGKEG